MLVQRNAHLARLEAALARAPVTALLGPRQCGKTTLARQVAASRKSQFFDLESAADQRRLENPNLALSGPESLIVLDEIQAVLTCSAPFGCSSIGRDGSRVTCCWAAHHRRSFAARPNRSLAVWSSSSCPVST
jgi:ABC-type phosphate transport system ATPase subunit